ncbi:MAG: metallophosphoesterase [Desulfitobacteriaceae bacterium]
MNNPLFILVFALVAIIYGGINYYIGLRGWQALFSYIPILNRNVYWTIFLIISLAYIVARLGERLLPVFLTRFFSIVGAFWLGAMFYFFLFIITVDIVRLLGAILHIWPQGIKQALIPGIGYTIFLFVIGIVIYGAWNAQHPQIKHYDLNVKKQAGTLSSLHIVMVSDIHLGTIVHNGYLSRLVERINQQNPDVVLFAGDIIDEKIETFIEKEITANFPNLKTKYGIYAVLGNHEYIGGHADEVTKFLNAAGVQVLRDSYERVADCFYVIGRDDISGAHFRRGKRESLGSIMNGVDKNLPIIVLDHQPVQLAEPQTLGVDLQLSGHTHQGQLFPIQFIIRKIFEDGYGYLRKDNLQLIVSSGYGTWGPPMRVGNKPEIVDITVHFND